MRPVVHNLRPQPVRRTLGAAGWLHDGRPGGANRAPAAGAARAVRRLPRSRGVVVAVGGPLAGRVGGDGARDLAADARAGSLGRAAARRACRPGRHRCRGRGPLLVATSLARCGIRAAAGLAPDRRIDPARCRGPPARLCRRAPDRRRSAVPAPVQRPRAAHPAAAGDQRRTPSGRTGGASESRALPNFSVTRTHDAPFAVTKIVVPGLRPPNVRWCSTYVATPSDSSTYAEQARSNEASRNGSRAASAQATGTPDAWASCRSERSMPTTRALGPFRAPHERHRAQFGGVSVPPGPVRPSGLLVSGLAVRLHVLSTYPKAVS